MSMHTAKIAAVGQIIPNARSVERAGCPACGHALLITTDALRGVTRVDCPTCERIAQQRARRAQYEADALRFVARHFGLTVDELERRATWQGELPKPKGPFTIACSECGRALTRKITPRTNRIRCPKCWQRELRRRNGARTGLVRRDTPRTYRAKSCRCGCGCAATFEPSGPASKYCARCKRKDCRQERAA